jgi:hypothetical protein
MGENRGRSDGMRDVKRKACTRFESRNPQTVIRRPCMGLGECDGMETYSAVSNRSQVLDCKGQSCR